MLTDTTNVISPKLDGKARLPKNMVGENWYVENTQAKRDRDWEFRPNVFDIYEEESKQIEYSHDYPVYSKTEAVIDSVYSQELRKTMSDSWAKLSFKDLSHNRSLGKRFRFNEDLFHTNPPRNLTEQEMLEKSSIWLTVNLNKIKLNGSCIVRRCNSNIGFAGSTNLSYDNITEYHYEPCVIDDTEEYVNQYYTAVVPVVSGGIYLTMQYNYYTSFIKVNDRVIVGGVDLDDLTNNLVYKVKYVSRVDSNKTFGDKMNSDIDDIDLIIVSLGKDTLSLDDDDFKNRIANRSVLYKIPVEGEKQEKEVSYLTIKNYSLPYIIDLYTLDGEQSYQVQMIKDGSVVDLGEFSYTAILEGSSDLTRYCSVSYADSIFKVKCKKAFKSGQLVINMTSVKGTEVVTQNIRFNLKGAV